ncbi:MAG: hypothetical protein AAGH60_09985, partial [Pseudomonadota bacterium]
MSVQQSLVSQLANAQGKPHLWPALFDEIGEAFNGVGALLELYNDTGQLTVVGPRSPFFDDALIRAYVEHYQPLSPRARMMADPNRPPIQFDALIGREADLDKNAFYAEFLPQTGLRYFISASFDFDAGVSGVLSVQRTAQAGPVDDDEIALMRDLRAPITALVASALPALTRSATTDALAAVLPIMAPLGAVMGPDGHILIAGDAVSELNGVERFSAAPQSGWQLSAAWRDAVFVAGRRSISSGLTESSADLGDGLIAEVRALTNPWTHHVEDELHRPLPVLVFVLRFRRPRTDPERTLTNRYNLTGRELETLLALA